MAGTNPDAHLDNARIARARLAAHRRWHPGDDLDQLTREFYREMELSRIDEQIDDLVDRAPRMTPVQLARLRRIASTASAAEDGDAVAS